MKYICISVKFLRFAVRPKWPFSVNKRGSVASAQKASRVTKNAKVSQVKQSTKRKRTVENEVVDENTGPTELISDAKRQRRDRGPVSIPEPVPEPTQAPRLRRRRG
jgi:hypothetical protein